MKNEFEIGRDESVRLIVRTCLENGVASPEQIAYVLATAQHESMNFTRAEEINGRRQAQVRGYGGGEDYYGRGYVQLTHKENYEKFDRLLGLGGELTANVELAKQPEIAARVLVVGMRDGLFRSHRGHHRDGFDLGEFINSEKTDFHDARYIINGITSRYPDSIRAAELVESYAKGWLGKVPALIASAKDRDLGVGAQVALKSAQHDNENSDIRHLQHLLNRLGYRDAFGHALQVDGDFGERSQQAVHAFQRAHGLPQVDHVGPRTREALRSAERSPSPVDPVHPDHALYRQAVAGVHRLDQEHGRAPDAGSDRLAASLTRLAKENGLSRVDHVVLSIDNGQVKQGEHVFVVQGAMNDPAHRLAYMKTQLAIDAPVAESFRQLEQGNAPQRQPALQVEPQVAPRLHAPQAAAYAEGPRMVPGR